MRYTSLPTILLYCVVLLLSGLLTAESTHAQDADIPPSTDPLPSLDDLLGTEGNTSYLDRDTTVPENTADDALNQLLSGQEIADEFRAAVELMGRSARRLTAARDTSLTTQRLQEDVLRKLDKLIADAEQRSQQNSNSSSSSSSPQQEQQNTQQPAQGSPPQSSSGENRNDTASPSGQSGPLGPELAADLAAWGALPNRVRDALVQGSSDRFSATYRKLTEAYFRMLAEEPKQ